MGQKRTDLVKGENIFPSNKQSSLEDFYAPLKPEKRFECLEVDVNVEGAKSCMRHNFPIDMQTC